MGDTSYSLYLCEVSKLNLNENTNVKMVNSLCAEYLVPNQSGLLLS